MKKQTKIYLIATLITIALLGAGVTAAYFAANVLGDENTNVIVTTTDGAILEFIPGDALIVGATMSNFQENAGNLSFESTPKVKLTVDEDYTTEYYVYFKITENDFVYTSDKAELVLVIKDPEGTEITQIDGLEYITGESQNGFDITTKTGLFEISVPEEITSITGEEIETWSFELFFINLDTNQNENAGKTFAGEVIMQAEEYDNVETLTQLVLAANGGTSSMAQLTSEEFESGSTADEAGMYAAADDYGTSYYFRGAVDNNWVYYAGYYWRIVRIDGDGNVKLIFAGSEIETDDGGVTSTANSSATNCTEFNTSSDSPEYVGYMYSIGTMGLSSDDSLVYDSAIKQSIDTWYEENILGEYDSYLADVIWCNDRTSYTTEGSLDISNLNTSYTTDKQYFGSYARLDLSEPSLECANIEDSFTVNDSENGNAALDYPIATITIDEIFLAGGTIQQRASAMSTIAVLQLQAYYLYNESQNQTLSPYNFDGNTNVGVYSYYYLYISIVNNENVGVQVSVSLKSDTVIISGDGTYLDPYYITEFDDSINETYSCSVDTENIL